ncbi:MAG: hydroxymethylglutaryl-CoA reductase [Candidatus Cloacimonetes bacterium 4572_55]|nr:MAG: hydroxymethylglutaryl-CoA reductase [Candidatus Cloacimonetes bacterium 4572_55]
MSTKSSNSNKDRTRIPGFYKLSIPERLKLLHQRELLSNEDFNLLKNSTHLLRPEDSDKMIENVVGVFGLPLAVGLNFLVNKKSYLVPMAVEEPSIVAAVSSMARIVRESGGFVCDCDDPILIGQIQVVDIKELDKAQRAIMENKREIINLANSLHPNMAARGGGVRDVETRLFPDSCHRGDMLIVHLLVDVQESMGANLVNSLCEGVASLIEKIAGGRVFLRILSNLADRSLARAQAVIPIELLGGKNFSGEKVRDGIILANEFALADPYRAATHNKGIMNGIDPVLIATGNDWRAAEAGAHAYAARNGQYQALTRWEKNANGDLIGKIELPIRVGIVGAQLESNPAVLVGLRISGVQSSAELAQLLAAVGLAQNMGALRALATEGIQRGHMSLHARSVAAAANAGPKFFDIVVEKLIDSGEIKVWKAKEIVKSLKEQLHKSGKSEKREELSEGLKKDVSTGFGKIILFGEHAVVYGSHAIAAPMPLGVQARVSDGDNGIHLIIPRWGVEERLDKKKQHKFSIFQALDRILNRLDLHDRDMRIEMFPHLPRAMGLGGSAALAVAIIRALTRHYGIPFDDEEVCDLAYESETIVHGAASGIDNTLATYGRFLLFQKGDPPKMETLIMDPPQKEKSLPIVVGLTWVESLTAKMVAKVRRLWEDNRAIYDRIFEQIDMLTIEAADAIRSYDLEKLGELMNVNQGLLNALQVSTREIEEIVSIARSNGALGAKLTGGGGGGAVIALCPDRTKEVAEAIQKAGYKAFVVDIA